MMLGDEATTIRRATDIQYTDNKRMLFGLTRLFLPILTVTVSFAPFFLPQRAAAIFLLCYALVVVYYTGRQSYYLFLSLRAVKRSVGVDWRSEFEKSGKLCPMKWDDVVHCIIIPNYNEASATIEATLSILSHHRGARSSYFIVLAMEQGEKDATAKAQQLREIYCQAFLGISSTMHPDSRQGEARGKSSNVAWAASHAEEVMVASMGQERFNQLRVMLTVIDADAHVQEAYFECLTMHCLTDTDIEYAVFAMPVSYFRNFYDVPAFVRVHDMLYTTLVLHNLAESSLLKFPSGHYSLCLKTSQRMGCAWDVGPESIGEDVHTTLRCMFAFGDRLRVVPIYVPVSCTNVHGDTWFRNMAAKFSQLVRHFMGGLDLAYCITNSFYPGPLSIWMRVCVIWKMIEFHVLAPSQLSCVFLGVPFLTHVYPDLVYDQALILANWLFLIMLIPGIANAVGFELYRRLCLRMERHARLYTAASRHRFWHFFDWFLLPITGAIFAVVPAYRAQLGMLASASYEYISAPKPPETISDKAGTDVV